MEYVLLTWIYMVDDPPQQHVLTYQHGLVGFSKPRDGVGYHVAHDRLVGDDDDVLDVDLVHQHVSTRSEFDRGERPLLLLLRLCHPAYPPNHILGKPGESQLGLVTGCSGVFVLDCLVWRELVQHVGPREHAGNWVGAVDRPGPRGLARMQGRPLVVWVGNQSDDAHNRVGKGVSAAMLLLGRI